MIDLHNRLALLIVYLRDALIDCDEVPRVESIKIISGEEVIIEIKDNRGTIFINKRAQISCGLSFILRFRRDFALRLDFDTPRLFNDYPLLYDLYDYMYGLIRLRMFRHGIVLTQKTY